MEDLVDTFLSFTGAFDRGTAVKFLEVIYLGFKAISLPRSLTCLQ